MLSLLLLFAVLPLPPVSVACSDGAFSTVMNPAALGANRGLDFAWLYSFQGGLVRESWRNHSLLAAAGPVGAYLEPGPAGYGLAAGLGSRGVYLGARLAGDSTGSKFDLGTLVRPVRWVSVGAVLKSVGGQGSHVQASVAVRPFTERVTIFADAALIRPVTGVLGIQARPFDGVSVAIAAAPGASLRETRWTAGAELSGKNAGLGWLGSVAPGHSRLGESGLYFRVRSPDRPSLLPGMPRYLEMKLSGRIVEQKPSLSFGAKTRQLSDIVGMLERARRDRSVIGLLLWLDMPQMSMAQAEEVRAALEQFRSTGKRVLVYSPGLGMNDYYLASVADRIACHPLGGVDIPGYAAQSLFLKGSLEKLGLEVQTHRHGRYKSAIEMFTEDSMSPASREQLGEYIDAVYGAFRDDVAAGRRNTTGWVDSLVTVAWFRAGEAEAAGLVDTLLYYDEVAAEAKRVFGRAIRLKEADYSRHDSHPDHWGEMPAVAVVYAVGDITTGRSGTSFITGRQRLGSETLAGAIAAVRKDRRVKAVVLRIDSPGGDGFASDIVWRELELLRKQKPLVVSMGSVAASGGFYIACNARRVFASRTTLTGSIGIFGLGLVTEGLFNKLGARREVVKRGERADAQLGLRRYTLDEDSTIQAQLDWWYQQFVEKVAIGRGMSQGAVDSVGQGRIWSGADALRVGLVDSLGGLRAALDCARGMAGLGECEYIVYPRRDLGLVALRDALTMRVLEELLR